MIQTNLFTKQTHRLGNQIYGYQRERSRRGISWEFGIDVYTLLYIKCTIREISGGQVVRSPHSRCQGWGKLRSHSLCGMAVSK